MRNLVPLAFAASVAVHVGLLLLVQRAVIAHRNDAAAARAMKTQQVVLLPPPDPEPPPPAETPKPESPKPPPPKPKPEPEPEPKPEPEQLPEPREVSLGIDAPNPPSEVWLGYKDFLEQFAAPGKVDQAAFTDKPVMAAPTPPDHEQENASAPPAEDSTPTEAPTEPPDRQDPPPRPMESSPPQPTDAAAATDAVADPEPPDLAQVLQSLGLTVPDLVRPESSSSEEPHPQDIAGDQPRPAESDSIPDERDGDPNPDGSDAPPAVDGALTPKSVLSPHLETASAKTSETTILSPATTQAATQPGKPAEDLVAKESAPRPKPRPTPSPRPPASSSASDLAIWRTSTGELRMGAQADKESDASSVIIVPRDQWRLGKPLAGRGIELKPRRPEFTELMRLTSAPDNPLVQIAFASDGVPVDARILKSSGDNRIDEAITSSLYRWRASGDELKKLSPRGVVQVTMRIIINGRAESD